MAASPLPFLALGVFLFSKGADFRLLFVLGWLAVFSALFSLRALRG